jgi:hypothetical protein
MDGEVVQEWKAPKSVEDLKNMKWQFEWISLV